MFTEEQIAQFGREGSPPFPWGIGSTRADFVKGVRRCLNEQATALCGLTNEQILAVGAEYFKMDPPPQPRAQQQFCDAVRAVIARYVEGF